MYSPEFIYIVDPKPNGRVYVTKLHKPKIDINMSNNDKIEYNITALKGKTIVKDHEFASQNMITLLETKG